jgi:inorganic pyrophosphatase/exopolyphosphatase
MIKFINLKDFGMNQEKIRVVKDKIVNSEKFNFNEEEIELIYKLTGFDLLTVSEMRAALLLFSGLSVRRLDAKPD